MATKNMCIEFILRNENKEISCNDEDIKKYMTKKKLFPNDDQKVYVFDLHNVLDKINKDFPIKDGKSNRLVICCSYVGYNTDILKSRARTTILEKIKSKQIDYGVLVFNRGKRIKKEKKLTKDISSKARIKIKRELTENIGSKAWFCNLVNCDMFFDDGKDHIDSVRKYTNSQVFHVVEPYVEENIIKFINDNINKMSGGFNFYIKYLKYKNKYLTLKKFLNKN